MDDLKSPKQEVTKHTYEEYLRDPIACGYTLVEENGKQYYSKTMKHDNYTATILRPVLTDEERKKREKQVEVALSRFFRNCPDSSDSVEN